MYVRTYVCTCSCKEVTQDLEICSTVLTNTHYAPSTYNPDILGINASLNDLNGEIKRLNELPAAEFVLCGELVTVLNCVIKYPACNANMEKLIPICPSQCTLIDFQIAHCLLVLDDLDFLLVKRILNSFHCNNPQTYYNFPRQYFIDETNFTNCLMISKLQ